MKNGYKPIEIFIYNENNIVVDKQFILYKNSKILDFNYFSPILSFFIYSNNISFNLFNFLLF